MNGCFPWLVLVNRRRQAKRAAMGFWETVGDTPLIEISNLSALFGRRILGKAEFLNPGGSVKDRAAKGIVAAAETSGRLQPGGTIVEGTAGNTGIALALIANERGYKCTIVVPDDQSSEKIELLRTFGAEVHVVPSVPFTDSQNYYHVARRIAAETPRAVWSDQFENMANRDAHEATTGPEIWKECGGRIDAFAASAGTGGTIAGVSRALKARNEKVQVVLCDPMGSSLYSYITTGKLQFESESDLEGIGIKRITANFSGAPIDRAMQIADRDAIAMTRWLLQHEGLFVGGSSGLNVLGALRVARDLPKGSTIVTILCDGGGRYLSRLFNEVWLREHDVPTSLAELA